MNTSEPYEHMIAKIYRLVLGIASVLPLMHCLVAAEFSPIVNVEGQPLGANIERVIKAFEFLGADPFPGDVKEGIRRAIRERDAVAMQKALHPFVLCDIHLNPESRVKVMRGGLENPGLQQAGYTPFLIRLENLATVTAPLRVTSPQAGKVYSGVAKLSMERQERPDLRENENENAATDRFLDVEMFRSQPMTPQLSGLNAEYAIVLVYSHESGKREATLAFDVGDGTQDLGFRGEVPILFSVKPAIPVTLRIADFDGTPTTARLVFQDDSGRFHPLQAKRKAPDLFFQRQIYRADGEAVLLPPGKFTVQSSRGPEYQVETREVDIPAEPTTLEFSLKRWVHPQERGFYSGDHHIHASGCAHYQFPTVGIEPAHVLPHVKGEGLNVGCVLTWGPGFEHQRQFFEPDSHPVSEPLTLIKYDLEISGFGSAPLGHVCLLNLKDQTYPGSEGTKEKGWPSWTVPVMRWCKEQGGVAGYAHSASGLHVEPENEGGRLVEKFDGDGDGVLSGKEVGDELLPHSFEFIDRNRDDHLQFAELVTSLQKSATELPNYAIPGMNGAGALEIAVSSVEGVCDFISAMDTARIQEWNTWYHILNCGLDVKVSGETDFPCMSGTRVGQGRVYVRMDGEIENLDYSKWCEGMAAGRSYVSDGYAHALEFSVGGQTPGNGTNVDLAKPGNVQVNAVVSFAPETPIGVPYGTADSPLGRAKKGDTVVLHIGEQWNKYQKGGKRLVEIVVNGEVVGQKTVPADGKEHELSFDVPIEQSSWVALRHFPQLHTNPVSVIVDQKPIQASARSAQWCIEMIDKLWQTRNHKIHEGAERDAAKVSYQKAKDYYQAIVDSIGSGV